MWKVITMKRLLLMLAIPCLVPSLIFAGDSPSWESAPAHIKATKYWRPDKWSDSWNPDSEYMTYREKILYLGVARCRCCNKWRTIDDHNVDYSTGPSYRLKGLR